MDFPLTTAELDVKVDSGAAMANHLRRHSPHLRMHRRLPPVPRRPHRDFPRHPPRHQSLKMLVVVASVGKHV